MPNNCIFLVDTYDTIEGARKAIRTGEWLCRQGHEMIGVRLDSGDLADLSRCTRAMLNAAGFPDAKIVASNDLDESLIAELKEQGAQIDIWGVGTRLVTAYDQPALGGVYKLSVIRMPGENWQYRPKVTEESVKTSNPGILQVRRYFDGAGAAADGIYDIWVDLAKGCEIVSLDHESWHRRMGTRRALSGSSGPRLSRRQISLRVVGFGRDSGVCADESESV